MKTLFVLLAVVVCFSAYAATDVRSGAWTAELDGSTLQLTLFRGRDGDSHMQNVMGVSLPLTSFADLAQSDVASSAANVRFEMRRSPGTIVFDGRFSDGTGAGHFRFNPSEAFVREMESLGFSGFRDDELLVFAIHDFSPQTIRDLRAMGYQPTKREVEEIAVFHITADLLREYARLGYRNLTLRDAVDLRVGRVDAAFIAAMRELGYTDLTARQMADLAIIGVKPAYVRELRGAGLTNLTPTDLTELRIGHVDAARIAEYRKLGYTDLSARQLSELAIQRVTPQFIQELRALGYDKIAAGQLIEMKTMGVTPDYIRKMNALGYSKVPPEKLLKLKMSGLIE